MVQDRGPQNATLSPPKYRCGLPSLNKVAKSILNPIASGIRPSMVAVAVSKTGVIRVRPASITASFTLIPCSTIRSVNSTSKIPFLTTIPARATIPIPDITIDISMRKMVIPKITPIILNNISLKIISGLLTELNWVTSIIRIKPRATSMAVPKKAAVSNCSSCSPAILT